MKGRHITILLAGVFLLASILGMYNSDAMKLNSNKYTVWDKAHTVIPCGKNHASSCDEFYLSLQSAPGVTYTKEVTFETYSTHAVGDTVVLQERVPGTQWQRNLIGMGYAIGFTILLGVLLL